MLAGVEQIEEWIPHRAPMRLVEELSDATDTTGCIHATVRTSWPLVTGGVADPIVLIELVAQGAACLAGYRKRDEERLGGRGWLVGVRRTRLSTRDLPVGTELTARIRVEYEVDNYAVFTGQVFAGAERLAEVEIQTYRPATGFFDEEEQHAGPDA